MKITAVSYRRLKNLGNYENEAVEATALVEDWEDSAQTLDALRSWVEDQLEIRGTVKSLHDQRNDLRHELEQLNSQIAAAGQKWQKIEEFLARLGVKVTDVSDIPF